MTLAIVCLAPLFATASANATEGINGAQRLKVQPGFNCARAHSSNERMICSDAQLAQLDHDLMQLYTQARHATHNSSEFRKHNDSEWLWREQHCNSRDCLLQWYARRREQLMQALHNHGPDTSHARTVVDSLMAHSPMGNSSIIPAPITHSRINTVNSTIPVPKDTDEGTPVVATTVPSQSVQALSQTLITAPFVHQPMFWIIGIGAVAVLFLVWEMFAHDGQSRKRARLIAAAVRNNIEELSQRQLQLVTTDQNGLHDPKKWDKEKRRFIEDAVKPALTDCAPLSATEAERLSLILDYLVCDEQCRKSRYRFHGMLDESCQAEYLRFCMRLLKDRGWKVRCTGYNKPDAHLLAGRDGLTLIAKCKAQSVPVGADTIREAQSLKQKHDARKAVIISNAPFATAAHKQANESNTLLLHHFDLSLLEKMSAR